MNRNLYVAGALAFSFGLVVIGNDVSAKPKITVDNTSVNFGVIREGSIEKLSHAFTLRNTGDQALKISQVRSG